MKKHLTFDEYAAQESTGVLNGDKLVAPEQLLERWKITPGELRKLYRGRHSSGLLLPVIEFGPKTKRFRLTDVLWLEYQLMKNVTTGREVNERVTDRESD